MLEKNKSKKLKLTTNKFKAKEESAIEYSEIMETPASFGDDLAKNKKDLKVFDSSIILSENPFDILGKTTFKPVKTSLISKTQRKSVTSDELLLSTLLKPKTLREESAPSIKVGIYKKLEVIAKKELFLLSRKYYKFPFEISVINDESKIFKSMRDEMISALSSTYSNYRKFGETFKVLLNEDIFTFSNIITCSPVSMKFLKSNDIKFNQENDILIIEKCDSSLLYDSIMNYDIPKGKALPFILSEFEFENGIVFRTKIHKGPVIKTAKGLEFSYTITGPVDSSILNNQPISNIEYVECLN